GSAFVYSTYLGGSLGEIGYGIAADAAGNAYVVGTTGSPDFPLVNPFQTNKGLDAFVTKLKPDRSAVVYSTYLGGNNDDYGFAIAVDKTGSASVTGFTGSDDFPTLNAFQPQYEGYSDAFVTKFTHEGNALRYSSYLGGSGADGGQGVAVDRLG